MNIHVQFGLIIFVVSEKKAFEHFPIGFNVNLCIAVAAKNCRVCRSRHGAHFCNLNLTSIS